MTVDLGTLAVGIGGDLAELKRTHREANRYIGDLERNLRGLKRTSAQIFGGLGAGFAAREALKAADAYSLMNSRIGLVTDSLQQQKQVQRELMGIAQETGTAYGSVVEMYARVGQGREELGRSAEELLRFTEQIQKLSTISGAGSEESKAAIIQLSQGLASGVLRGEELNSVLEQTPAIARSIAEGMGIGFDELREVGRQGEITADAVIEAILRMESETNAAFEQIGDTAGRGWQRVKNAGLEAIGGLNQELGATDKIADGLTSIADHMDDIAAAAKPAAVAISGIFLARGAGRAANFGSDAIRGVRDHAREVNRLNEAHLAHLDTQRDLLKEGQRAVATQLREAENARRLHLATRERTQAALNEVNAKILERKEAIASAQALLKEAEAMKKVENDGRRLRGINNQIAESNRVLATETRALAREQERQSRLQHQLSSASRLRVSSAERRSETQAAVALRNDLKRTTGELAAVEAARTAALQKMTVASRMATVAASGFRTALGFVGGPVGAAFLAAGAIAYLNRQLKENQREAKEARDRVLDYAKAVEDAAKTPVDVATEQFQEARGLEVQALIDFQKEQAKLNELRELYANEYSPSSGSIGAEFSEEAGIIAKQKKAVEEAAEAYNNLKEARETLAANLATATEEQRKQAEETERTGRAHKAASDAMKQYLDDLRWQNRELELTIAGREDLIAQEKAEAQVREIVNRMADEQNWSEERKAQAIEQGLIQTRLSVAENLRLNKALEDQEAAARRAGQENQKRAQALSAAFQRILADMEKAREEEDRRQATIDSALAGYDLEIQMARNRLELTEKQAAIENQILHLRQQYGLTDDQAEEFRRRIEELQMIEAQSRESFGVMERTGTAAISGIEQSFESFFNDSFRGELKTAESYFYEFTNALYSEWARMLARMIAEKAAARLGEFGGVSGGGSSGDSGSGWAGTLLNAAVRGTIGFFVGGPAGAAIGAGSALAGGGGGSSAGGGLLLPEGSYAAAKGMVVDRPMMAASGAIIDQPTLLGRRTIGGEAGPEAVLPLQRGRGGNLGILATVPEPGGVVINIIDQSKGEHEYNTSERRDRSGQRVIDVLIKSKVKEAFVSGEMDGILKNGFGLTRKGWGR